MSSTNIGSIARTAALMTSLTFAGLNASGCSVVMEATRPTPVDLSQFPSGQAREAVFERLGAPKSTMAESDGTSCDFYQLYTRGPGAAGKASLAFLEGAADVFTLGLAETVTTPVEGATKNELHPVTFCYRGGKLVRVSENSQPAGE